MEIKIKPPARIGDYDRGVAAERERIIKLITDNDVIGVSWWIALINGENTIYLSERDYNQLNDAIEGENK